VSCFYFNFISFLTDYTSKGGFNTGANILYCLDIFVASDHSVYPVVVIVLGGGGVAHILLRLGCTPYV
jgi:hypothetical protein